jgi:serine/threonine protein kinase/Tol biopolymer transport system component
MVGKTISHYQIVKKLGEGGMGVVYQARDTRLDRFVAIKVLSARTATDLERKLRFVQEAKSASALNHPNIITVYDIDTSGELAFIAMEYIDGNTLDGLINHAGLHLGEALRYAVQIADALASAHSVGIIHRDIKPANIMVTEKGLVKVLDFGLAKMGIDGLSDSDSELTATYREVPQTDEGTILGTIAYMSPEQAQGKKIDVRSDIFSFGAVLYEMITGERAFRGETKLSTLASLINQEPKPASQIIEGLPREVERIIALCLRKDPSRRFQHMEDLKVGLEALKEESDSGRLVSTVLPVPTPLRRVLGRKVTIVGLMVIAVLLISAGWFYWSRASKSMGQNRGGRLTLVSADNLASNPTLSPDGKMIAFLAEDQGQNDLFVGRVAGGGRIRLTNDVAGKGDPRFSPDGERILFTRVASETGTPELWMVPTLGGQSVRLLRDATDGVWSPDGARVGFVLRRPGQGDALATAAADGTDLHIVLPSNATYPFFRYPTWSPDGAKLVVVWGTGGVSGELWLVPLTGGSPRRLLKDAAGVFSNQPVFTPDGSGIIHQSNRDGATNLWILFLEGNRLVRLTNGPGPDESPSVSRDGAIAFVNTRLRATLIVHDLVTGESRELLTHSSYIWAPAFSPDGSEIAYARAEMDGSWHIWIVPVQGGAARRLTSGMTPEIYPRFTPDGASLIYHTWSAGPDRIWRVPRLGGAAVPLTPLRDNDDSYADISPDGRWLAFARTETDDTRIYISPIDGGDARRLTGSSSTLPRWSPDGRWIAFSANRGFTAGIFIIGVDGTGVRRLSTTGSWPTWFPDGKRLGYLNLGPDGTQQILTVPFEGGPSRPLPVVRFGGANNPFDISRDGKLLTTSNGTNISSQIWLMSPEK